MRPIQAAFAGGSLSSVAFNVARELLRNEISGPGLEACPALLGAPIEVSLTWGLDFRSVVFGIAIGLLAGPILDLLYYLRHSGGNLARGSATEHPRVPYRILS